MRAAGNRPTLRPTVKRSATRTAYVVPPTGVGTTKKRQLKKSKSATFAGDDAGGSQGGGWSGSDSSTRLQPVGLYGEFIPLSLRPIPPGQTVESFGLADRYTLETQTPRPPGETDFEVEKNLDTLVPESEKMIKSGLHQARHSRAISAELKLLLKNEKKILDQITNRCISFAELKEENKWKTEEWYTESRRKLKKCDNNVVKLLSYTDAFPHDFDVDSSQGLVKQKLLLGLVQKTADAVNDISVQLSIENTIINEVQLSLSGLKKNSEVMLNVIDRWLRTLNTHDQNEVEILERWETIKQSLKELKEKPKQYETGIEEGEMSNEKILSLVNGYNNRIRRLEEVAQLIAS